MSTPRCLLKGAYAKVLIPRSALRGGLYSEVSTPRGLIQGANSKVPTPKYLLQSYLLQATYSEVSTPRCSLKGCLLRCVYSKVLTPRLFTQGLQPGVYIQTEFHRYCSLNPGASAQEPTPSQRPGDHDRATDFTPRTPSLYQGARLRPEQDHAQDNESTPRTLSLRPGHRVCAQDTESAPMSENTSRAFSQEPMPGSLRPGARSQKRRHLRGRRGGSAQRLGDNNIVII